ncbi:MULTISPECIES: DUF2783 domain-containing protein [Roseibium]|uniref:DUF2783 domain-containing protein n=2 Tax=Roseibium TaxID=150830 RepID=A0A0M6Y8B9_9HYPH|nr:DUF2783 domain-containing protein [Roseibium aggregatum]MEC9401267.1 DUF2783 domain-containing protein [Pseudomonadota bacterium]AQQ02774.1 DUF2783 domain-containing protein [Roseibium aggregatum]MEC9419134.1 DUF2783 domain-containing protein [Pseudomonadota bacterium]MEC9468422.1 DUF2783 domain-containing protein [Pseudomonadota bacterium]MEE2866448.1 DUF2783 domain-containing protein [Pseudomonadota bacterium]
MAEIVTKPNLETPDGFYADLLTAHEGLTKAESDAFNARLILLMANQIGERQVLEKLLEAAKQ